MKNTNFVDELQKNVFKKSGEYSLNILGLLCRIEKKYVLKIAWRHLLEYLGSSLQNREDPECLSIAGKSIFFFGSPSSPNIHFMFENICNIQKMVKQGWLTFFLCRSANKKISEIAWYSSLWAGQSRQFHFWPQTWAVLETGFFFNLPISFSGAVGGKTGKTSVLPWFSKIERGGGSGGGAPHWWS
jgi:hypothetical protein